MSPRAAHIAASELERFLLNVDGVLLKTVPANDNSDECFKAVILRRLRSVAPQLYYDADGH